MTTELMEQFRRAKHDRAHMVDIAHKETWVCPAYFDIDESNYLPMNTATLNKLNFCPFCGEAITYNKEDEKSTKRFIVYHFQPYYFGEVVTDEWYYTSFSTWERAFEEYTELRGAGFEEKDLYVVDTEYGVSFQYGEWSE